MIFGLGGEAARCASTEQGQSDVRMVHVTGHSDNKRQWYLLNLGWNLPTLRLI